MNSILLSENELQADGNYRLSAAKSTHIISSLRSKVGDNLKCTLLNKSLGKCEIVSLDNNVIVKVLETKPGTHFDIHLIVGASRPPTMKKILEHATSQGVSHFHIVHTELGEKSYLQSKIYQGEICNELLELGLSQSAIFYKAPKVTIYKRIEDIDISVNEKYILSPYAKSGLELKTFDSSKSYAFAIGSERGWTESELSKFRDGGFQEIKIGPSILRVEIATFSLLGIVNQSLI